QDELVGKHIRMIFAPECEEKVEWLIQSLRENGSITEEKFIIQPKSGEQRIVLLNANAIQDIEESSSTLILIQKDITDQKLIEQTLKEIEEALGKAIYERTIILDSISDHVVYQDLENRVIWANRAAAESVSLTAKELTGRYCHELWHKQETPCIDCPVVKARETGEFHEDEMKTPDGRIWLVRGYPIHDDNRNVIGCVEVTREITEQKRVEEAYHQLVDQSFQGLLIIQNGLVAFTNPAFLEITGYSEKEIMDFEPWEIFNIIHPEDRGKPWEQLQNIIHGEPISSSIELRGILKDGSIRWIALSLSIIEYQGQLATQATIIDIHERKIAEETIRIERDRAQQYLDVAGAAFVGIDAEQRIFLLNRKGCEIFGYSEEELMGQNYFEICIPQRLRAEMCRLFDLAMAGKYQLAEYLENPILTKDGIERIISWHTTILKNEEDQITGILSSGEDITEKKSAEAALKASEEKFRALVEDTADWVWEVNRDGQFKYSNSSVEDILGYTAGQILDRTLWEYMEPSEAEESESFFKENVESQRPFKSLVYKFIHRDGHIIFVEFSGRPIIDDNGIVLGYRGVCRDITQRIQAEGTLRESEARYRALVETSPDAITLSDPEGNIILVNDRTVRLLGYNSQEELIGLNCFDFMVPEERNRAIQDSQGISEHKAATPQQYILTRKDNSTFPSEISTSLLTNSNGIPIGFIFVIRDISQRKKAEQELEEAKAQAEFFTDLMAHDLSNINQAILSALELQLLDTDISERRRQQVSLALDQVERSSALIGRVKKFSRIGGVQPLQEIRDIEPDFQAALSTVRQAFPEKSIRVDTNIHPGKFKVLADDLLVDLFFNLLHNAVKFNRTEKVKINLHVQRAENRRFLRIELEDYGPGIPDDLKARIFARYTRRIGEKAQGSGIGLTLVQRIIGRYGGRIWVEDRVKDDHSKGAKFIFLLPVWS
ncbi:MAG: PAS domain S-box protein, partial [Candidatus Thorarchaeota archaeon]